MPQAEQFKVGDILVLVYVVVRTGLKTLIKTS
jgi:hypothetical protein